LATFLVFAVVSGYAGAIGKPSCGCLGAAAVNPWWILSFDLVVIASLLLGL
jgi:hypothetical protein